MFETYNYILDNGKLVAWDMAGAKDVDRKLINSVQDFLNDGDAVIPNANQDTDLNLYYRYLEAPTPEPVDQSMDTTKDSDIEVCRCMSASHCIFIWIPGLFADTFLKTNVSFICLFLSLQIHFALLAKYKYILNRFILRFEDTFQRQIVSLIYIFLHVKILSADQWYLRTLEIIIADTFSWESIEILIFNTIRINLMRFLIDWSFSLQGASSADCSLVISLLGRCSGCTDHASY